MSSELRELYQEVILDHNKRPHNFRALEHANRKAEGYNPLCGDTVTLFAQLGDDGLIQDVSFQGSGCAISKASASLLTDSVKGKSKAEAQQIFDRFHAMVTAKPDAQVDTNGLGKLAVFSGVREFPARVKCATLAWHTLKAALEGAAQVVTTETGD